MEEGVLVKRYKRFLADVKLPSGNIITIYCPNTGAMSSCSEPGGKVWFSRSDNPKRKYSFTWELYQDLEGDRVDVNTHRANHLVEEAIRADKIKELGEIITLQREVSLAEAKSRIDFVLSGKDTKTFLEVKSVTYLHKGEGYFPDAVTKRGQKHLEELVTLKEQGHRAILFFCVMHSGISVIKPAKHIDEKYAKLCQKALKAGVEFLGYACHINPQEVVITDPIEVKIE